MPSLLGSTYLLFAAVADRLRRSKMSCGCFGAHSSTVTWLHIALNLGCAAVAGAAAVTDVPAFHRAADDLPAYGLAHLLLVPAGAAAVVALFTILPATLALTGRQAATTFPVTFRMRASKT